MLKVLLAFGQAYFFCIKLRRKLMGDVIDYG